MKKHIALFSLLLAALVAVPAVVSAQQNDKPAKKEAPAEAPIKKKGVLPFHGKVAAVDANAANITIGEMTINITSETKIHKDGKPATISDITVGEKVAGAYKKDDSGKMNATMIRIGDKPDAGPAKEKKAELKEKAKSKEKSE